MVRSAEEAIKVARAQKTNVPGTCQLNVRTWLDSPSVGDVDRDGDADAVDGWKSEPKKNQHTDKKPPLGMPVAWSGGAKGYGHRAISDGPDKNGVYFIISTDAPSSGKTSRVPLAWVEEQWGFKYLGWSDTIGGVPIPTAPVKPKPEPKPKTSRGKYVDEALKNIKKTTVNTDERKKLKAQTIKLLEKWPLIK